MVQQLSGFHVTWYGGWPHCCFFILTQKKRLRLARVNKQGSWLRLSGEDNQTTCCSSEATRFLRDQPMPREGFVRQETVFFASCYPYVHLSDASDHSRLRSSKEAPSPQVGASTESPLINLKLVPDSTGPHNNPVLFSPLFYGCVGSSCYASFRATGPTLPFR